MLFCNKGSNSASVLLYLSMDKKKAGATELELSLAEAWITLGRAKLNFGEPDSVVLSFDKALAIKVHKLNFDCMYNLILRRLVVKDILHLIHNWNYARVKCMIKHYNHAMLSIKRGGNY